jgi:putative tricarboxylic transport membrane protein
VSKINYVPFRGGGEAAAAILSGHVTLGGSGYSEFLPHIAAGRMRPIAVTSPARIEGLNAPTLRELGIAMDLGNWRGVYAPSGLTETQRLALIQKVVVATESPSWKEALAKNGWMPALLTGHAFGAFVEHDFAEIRAMMERVGMV